MKKRIITAVIAAILILSSVLGMTACGNTSANDAEAVEKTVVEGTQISWEYKSDTKTLVISGTGAILDSEDSTQVPWYSVRHSVETVEITETGISAIGDYAFYNMAKLKNIKIPDTVTSIGKGAFAFCSSLEAIDLPVGLTSIGESCFEACTSLKNIFVPVGVTSIGSRAFALCAKLEKVEIVSTALTPLKDGTFMGCSSLNMLVMHESAKDEAGNLKIEKDESGAEKDPFKNCSINKDTVTYVSSTTKDVTVTINYVRPDGTPIHESKEVTGIRGAKYSEASPAVEGYKADRAVVEGEFADNKTETVTYEPAEVETEAVTEPVAETEPVDEGEGRPTGSKVGYIIAIVIFALVIAGIVVFAVIMIKSDKKNDKNGKKTNKKSDKKNGKK